LEEPCHTRERHRNQTVCFGHENLTRLPGLETTEGLRDIISIAVTDQFLFTGSYDFLIRRWNLRTGVFDGIFTGRSEAVEHLATSGPWLFGSSSDGRVHGTLPHQQLALDANMKIWPPCITFRLKSTSSRKMMTIS
jgi:WD40 repeat protein